METREASELKIRVRGMGRGQSNIHRASLHAWPCVRHLGHESSGDRRSPCSPQVGVCYIWRDSGHLENTERSV